MKQLRTNMGSNRLLATMAEILVAAVVARVVGVILAAGAVGILRLRVMRLSMRNVDDATNRADASQTPKSEP